MHIAYIFRTYSCIFQTYSMQNPYILHTCSINNPCLFHTYSIFICYIFHAQSRHISCIFHTYSIHIPYMLHTYSMDIPCIFYTYSMDIPCTIQTYSMQILYIIHTYSMYVPWPFKKIPHTHSCLTVIRIIFQNNFSSYQCNFLLRDQVKISVKSQVAKIESHRRSATHLQGESMVEAPGAT